MWILTTGIMNSNFNEQNTLIETLKETKKDYEKYLNKVANKLDKNIEPNKSFKAYLQGLTIDELKEIRKFWSIQGTSSLKKDELVLVLEEKILKNVESLAEIFDEERFNLISEVVTKGGYAEVNNLTPQNLSYLRKTGVLFPGILNKNSVVVLPAEIIEIAKKWDSDSSIKEKIQLNDKVIKVIKGILYHYGVVKENQLFNVFKGISKIDIDMDRLIKVVLNRYAYTKDFEISDELVYHISSEMPKNILEAQENSNMTYAHLSEDNAVELGTIGYIEDSKAKTDLMELLRSNYRITENEVEEIVNKCILMIKNGKLVSDVSEYLNKLFVVSDMNIYSKIIKTSGNLYNNTRVWTLKGNTPEEVRLMEENKFNISKTIGRNDPCTCGSGKKYKKCCGR